MPGQHQRLDSGALVDTPFTTPATTHSPATVECCTSVSAGDCLLPLGGDEDECVRARERTAIHTQNSRKQNEPQKTADRVNIIAVDSVQYRNLLITNSLVQREATSFEEHAHGQMKVQQVSDLAKIHVSCYSTAADTTASNEIVGLNMNKDDSKTYCDEVKTGPDTCIYRNHERTQAVDVENGDERCKQNLETDQLDCLTDIDSICEAVRSSQLTAAASKVAYSTAVDDELVNTGALYGSSVTDRVLRQVRATRRNVDPPVNGNKDCGPSNRKSVIRAAVKELAAAASSTGQREQLYETSRLDYGHPAVSCEPWPRGDPWLSKKDEPAAARVPRQIIPPFGYDRSRERDVNHHTDLFQRLDNEYLVHREKWPVPSPEPQGSTSHRDVPTRSREGRGQDQYLRGRAVLGTSHGGAGNIPELPTHSLYNPNAYETRYLSVFSDENLQAASRFSPHMGEATAYQHPFPGQYRENQMRYPRQEPSGCLGDVHQRERYRQQQSQHSPFYKPGVIDYQMQGQLGKELHHKSFQSYAGNCMGYQTPRHCDQTAINNYIASNNQRPTYTPQNQRQDLLQFRYGQQQNINQAQYRCFSTNYTQPPNPTLNHQLGRPSSSACSNYPARSIHLKYAGGTEHREMDSQVLGISAAGARQQERKTFAASDTLVSEARFDQVNRGSGDAIGPSTVSSGISPMYALFQWHNPFKGLLESIRSTRLAAGQTEGPKNFRCSTPTKPISENDLGWVHTEEIVDSVEMNYDKDQAYSEISVKDEIHVEDAEFIFMDGDGSRRAKVNTGNLVSVETFTIKIANIEDTEEDEIDKEFKESANVGFSIGAATSNGAASRSVQAADELDLDTSRALEALSDSGRTDDQSLLACLSTLSVTEDVDVAGPTSTCRQVQDQMVRARDSVSAAVARAYDANIIEVSMSLQSATNGRDDSMSPQW